MLHTIHLLSMLYLASFFSSFFASLFPLVALTSLISLKNPFRVLY